MKLSIVQYTPVYGAVSENRENLICLSQEAVNQGANIIVLPEMALSGYIWPNKDAIFPFCETATGESFQFFSEFCKTKKVFLAYGFAEKSGKRLFNSQNLIDDSGNLLSTYRKKHLFDADDLWAEPGDNNFISIKTKFGKLGLGICMDLNFDDFVEFHKKETDILLFATNWLEENIDVQKYWTERLNGFLGKACFANRSGNEYGIEFCGQSGIFSDGRFLNTIPKGKNASFVFSFK